jgi:nucleoside-diphosphate-sugar epimerase
MTVASLRITGINFDPTYEGFREVWKNPQPRVRILWTYVDGRDAALACRLAAEVDIQGHEVFNITAPTSRVPEDTHELIRRYLPDADNIREGVTGNWSCMDGSRAEERLGFKAQHTWEQYISPEEG